MNPFNQQLIQSPQFSKAEAENLVESFYGFRPTLKPLGSFQDQNFRAMDENGRFFILKIANSAATWDELDLQNQAMSHLAAKETSFPTPRIIPALNGQQIATVEREGQSHLVRLLTYVPGQLLADLPVLPPESMTEIGRFCGTLTKHLADFTHPFANQRIIQWDFQHALQVIQAFLPYVADPEDRQLIQHFVGQFEAAAAPLLPQLRKSIVHGDITSYNLLYSRDETGQPHITGLVDFGDTVHSYTIAELAVPIVEAILKNSRQPLADAARVVEGFHQIYPLTEPELAVLYHFLGIRMCVVVTSEAQQLSLDPGNQYVQELVAQDKAILRQLRSIHPGLAQAAFRQACGLPPNPCYTAVSAWLSQSVNSKQWSVISEVGTTVLDLSVGSDVWQNGNWETVDGVKQAITAGGIGRFNEARLPYTRPNQPDEPATIHLGIDIFAKAGTAVFAPFPGTVVYTNPYAVILQHTPAPDLTFYTRYAGVETAVSLHTPVAGGQQIATITGTGTLPPHLHFQIACDWWSEADLPGLVTASQRPIWLSNSPDPNLILGIPALQPAPHTPWQTWVERRFRTLPRSQEFYYQEPMQIVRGWRQYLYDANGRAYLDMINNVAHIGHSHPRIVEAARRQMALLNTNSRFLYDSMIVYAERLAVLMPEPLKVVFFVCTGSEANDLALRLARAYTRQHDVMVIDGEYHGNTTAVDEINTSLLDNPAAKVPRPHVHPVTQPNVFRGRYGANDPQAGLKYAQEVKETLDRLQENGRSIAAFFTEALLGASGGVDLPAHYLKTVYGYVRQAGGVCISDEVQVGFGRIGTHFWAFESQGVVPDIVTMGKPIGNGHPLSAVITTPDIAEAFRRKTTYFNTFGGNPVSCEVGMAVLDVIEQEQLQNNALHVGSYLKNSIQALMPKHALIGAVHGLGLYLGVELVRDHHTKQPATQEAARIAERMKEKGIIVYPTGDYYNILKIKPPIVFTQDNADFFVQMLDQILSEIDK